MLRVHFRISDTFTDSLGRLTGEEEEEKAVKTTAFDLQLNPVNPGLQFHRIAGARFSGQSSNLTLARTTLP